MKKWIAIIGAEVKFLKGIPISLVNYDSVK